MEQTNSTSSVLKGLCDNIYLISVGDFWHETTYRPKWKEVLYEIYSYLINIIMYGVILIECLEAIFNTFPSDQHRDAVSYSIAHINVFYKLYLFKRNKNEIKVLIHDIIQVCTGYEDESLLKKQRRKIKIAVILQFFVVYFSLVMYAFEGIRRMYFEGDIFVSVVTYWPLYEDRSPFAVTIRVLLVPTMFFMMATMIITESLIVAHLIILSFKFVTVRQYFENIGENFIKNCTEENAVQLTKQLKEDCFKGILMHRELLRLADDIHKVFGVMMALQVCQSSGVAVLLLLRLAFQQQQTLPNIFMSLFFMIALFIQLALYLWNAGDITYNAALIPDAIFHCGWYLCPLEKPSHLDMRRLILMGCAQGQRPVIMKAFGVQTLSYQTYVSVVRTTYSLFAVFY